MTIKIKRDNNRFTCELTVSETSLIVFPVIQLCTVSLKIVSIKFNRHDVFQPSILFTQKRVGLN